MKWMHLYLMFNPWLPFRFKIGITNNLDRRERENGAWTLFNFRLPAARYIEKSLHDFYAWAHWPASKKHSGRTEYFLCLNPMTACALFLLWPDLPGEYYAIVFFLPVPIDAAAILYAIAAVCYVGVFAIVGILGYMLVSYI